MHKYNKGDSKERQLLNKGTANTQIYKCNMQVGCIQFLNRIKWPWQMI